MARPGRVPLGVKLGYGFGQFGEAIFMGLTLTFAALYYNQGLGLEIKYVGWALGLAIFTDAISDPVIGALSDRWRSRRWGRRHPFLFIAPVPLALCLYFLFLPPDFIVAIPEYATQPEQMPLFLWMTVWNILARTFLTCYVVPHLALGAELSSDYNERSSVFSYNAMFGFATGTGVGFFAWGYFAGESLRAMDNQLVPGQLDPANYPPVVIVGCLLVILGIWTCAITTRNEIPHLAQAPEDIAPFSFQEVIRDMWGACQNRNYIMLLIAFFFLSLTLGLGEISGGFLVTYYFELPGDQIKWFPFAQLIGYVTGAFVTPLWVQRFEKRPVCITQVAVYAVITPLPLVLRSLNLPFPENHTAMLLPMLLLQNVVSAHCLGGLNVSVMSMLADVIDQHTLKTGNVQTGIFYSARTFFAKASNSISNLIAGVLFSSVVMLPTGAIPGKVAADVLYRLGVVAGPFAALGAVISIFFYANYRLSKREHAQIQEDLGVIPASAETGN
jgi:GPH family glycoside/pentoside/hexuronide:cation symporter